MPASKTFNKKARREKKRYHPQAQAWEDFGPLATGVNTTNSPNGAYNDGDQKDASKVIYYIYIKKEYFVRNFSKPWKNRDNSKN